MEKLKNRNRNPENYKTIYFQVGMIIALLCTLYAFEYKSYEKNEIQVFYREIDDTPMEFIEATKHDEPKKSPPVPVVSIVVVDDSKDIDDDIIDIDVGADETTEVKPWEPADEPDEQVEDFDPPIYIAEIQPSFPGGVVAMSNFINNNIDYPDIARSSNITGIVYVQFVVEKDGSITNVIVLREVGGGCTEEAVRMVNLMPKWNCGLQNGRPVRVQLNMPIKFSLL